jgi:hypothetical protein
MDPDVALVRLRNLANSIIREVEQQGHHATGMTTVEDLSWDMANLFQGLDSWLTERRANLPKDWREK